MSVKIKPKVSLRVASGMAKVKVHPKIPKTPSRVRSYVMGAADFAPNNKVYGINGITMVFVIVALQLCMGVWLMSAEERGFRERTKPA